MRAWLTALALATAALTASSCGSTPASNVPLPTSSVGTSPSTTNAGTTSSFAAPGIIPGLTPPPDLDRASFGAASFTVDAARKRSVEVPEDGPETTLSVTDQAGLTWTMVIPDGALTAPATITMAPMAELSSADIRGHLAGGVLLEPDGLQFGIPATLTVRGGPDDGTTVLLTGGSDGTGLELAMSLDASGRSALISHFSTVIDVDGADQAWVTDVRDKTTADATAAVAAAAALIKTDVSVPEPPSIPLECVSPQDTEVNDGRLAAFRKAVLEPERGLAFTLLGAAQTGELTGEQADHRALIGQLLARLERKADLLIQTYGSLHEKLRALTWATIDILSLSGLAGQAQESGDALRQRLSVRWDAMVNRVADTLIRDLVEKHDYRKADALWRVARDAVLVGSNRDSAIWGRIEAALRFRLDVTLNSHWSGAVWLVRATIPMGYWRDDPARSFAVGGPEPGEYVALESDVLRSVSTESFNVTASLKILDACAGTARLKINRLYGDSETYQVVDDPDAPPPITMPLLKEAFTHAFEKDLDRGLYVFPVNLHNLDAVMVNTSIERRPPKATGDWSETLDIVVTHTPGK